MTKPPGETEALEPQVDLRDLAKSALTKIPGLGDVLEVVDEAHRRSRDRRKHQWAAYVAYGSDEGAEFAAKLRAAFESTEGELVRSVVLEGARAAVTPSTMRSYQVSDFSLVDACKRGRPTSAAIASSSRCCGHSTRRNSSRFELFSNRSRQCWQPSRISDRTTSARSCTSIESTLRTTAVGVSSPGSRSRRTTSVPTVPSTCSTDRWLFALWRCCREATA